MKAKHCSSTSAARLRYPSTNAGSGGGSIRSHCGTTGVPSTTLFPITGPTDESWNGPPLLEKSPFNLLASHQVKNRVLEREVEVGTVPLLLLLEPLECLLDRLPETVPGAPADMASEFVRAEHEALIPAVQIWLGLLDERCELPALQPSDRVLAPGVAGADIDA